MHTAHIIDTSIFLGFLVINLVVGLRYGRHVKTLRDYSTGGKNFSTATLVATIVATWITGRYLTTRIAYIYQDGFYAIILYLCELGAFMLTGWLFAMRMGPFLQSFSIAEAMGNIYGRLVRTITAIFGLTVSVGLASFQLISGEKLLNILLGWNGPYSIVIIGIIIILYSVLGGVRAVTFTDVLQFFTFGTLLPVLALTIWNSIDGFGEMGRMIQATPHWDIKAFLTSPESTPKWRLLTFMPLFLIPAFTPAIFQRAIMAKNVYQVRNTFLYSSLVYLLIISLIIWIAFLIRIQNPNLSFDEVLQYIVDRYAPAGFRGLFLSGFTAMLMSTADSNLNAAGSILANDIIVPFVKESTNPLLKRFKSDHAQVVIARIGSLIIGILALMLAFYSIEHGLVSVASISASWVLPWTLPWNFYMAVVAAPLLLSILGFRSTKRTVIIGMLAGFLTVYLWVYLFPDAYVDSSLPGMLVNFIIMMSGYYLFGEPGGWQPVHVASPLAWERASRQQAWRRRWNNLRAFKLYPYLQQNLPAQEGLHFCLGLYILTVTYVAFYTVGKTENIAYYALYEYICYAVLPITTALLTFPIWPHAAKQHWLVVYLWPISLGGTFFFAGTLLAILSGFHWVQVMIIMINFLMAILLLRGPLALSLAFLGVALAIFFFKQYTGMALPLSVSDLLQFRLLYGFLIFASFVAAFLKGKQVYRALVASYAQLNTDKNFISQFVLDMYRYRTFMLQKASAYPTIKQGDPVDALYSNPSREQLRGENEALHHHVYQLDTYNRYLKQVLHGTQHPIPLAIESVALKSLWQEVLETVYQRQGAYPVVTQYHTTGQMLQADITKVKRLLSNALTYVTSQQEDNPSVLLGFEDTQLAYPVIAMPGYIKYVKAVRMAITTAPILPNLKAWYLGSIDHIETEWPQEITALPITYNQQIVEAHYGFAKVDYQQPSGITLVYVIPWDVREVRPPVMDQWQSPTTPEGLDSPVSPAETAFVEAVHAKTPMDDKLLQQALLFIKQHYGAAKHDTGEFHYLRAIAVAQVVLEYTADANTLLAALMHAIIDKTHCSSQQLALYFNPVVQRIVEGVSRVDSRLQSSKKLQLSHLENRQKLLASQDKRVLYVALAIRLHDVRQTAGDTVIEKQQQMAQEILRFFVPLAIKIGLKRIAAELKAQCLLVLRKEVDL
ncbi:MAG: sodium:solute symporter family transporter [Bacteroidota bacterium]